MWLLYCSNNFLLRSVMSDVTRDWLSIWNHLRSWKTQLTVPLARFWEDVLINVFWHLISLPLNLASLPFLRVFGANNYSSIKLFSLSLLVRQATFHIILLIIEKLIIFVFKDDFNIWVNIGETEPRCELWIIYEGVLRYFTHIFIYTSINMCSSCIDL